VKELNKNILNIQDSYSILN